MSDIDIMRKGTTIIVECDNHLTANSVETMVIALARAIEATARSASYDATVGVSQETKKARKAAKKSLKRF